MDIKTAKEALDKVIKKSRVHLYKPIQAAEILHRDRVHKDINLENLETYRSNSKRWRDIISTQFVGRQTNSSSKYQDDIFSETALPPAVLTALGKENRAKNGIVEAYIYQRFGERFGQVNTGVSYCFRNDRLAFDLQEFFNLFWNEPGLRRSIDKIYEIVVYALFSALVEVLEVTVEVSLNEKNIHILTEFEDFAARVINLTRQKPTMKLAARINRGGVTNASDRGLDMWANFGLAIQIKHLSLSEELAESIITSVSADRIVIVCKDTEQKIIVSLLNQIGWKSRIQSIITESDLLFWYEKALRGKYANLIGEKILTALRQEIQLEFPVTDGADFNDFLHKRGYDKLQDKFWQ
jgi:hypothetical protein